MELLKVFLHRARTQPLLVLAFLQALIATAGSLYFSEVWGLVPCKLCWFQRIFMYPLAIIFPIGIFHQDKRITSYTLPLALVGLAIAAYHTGMYYLANYIYGVNELVLTACQGGVSCTNKQVAFLGFISIPLLSFVAFLIITVLLWQHRHSRKPLWKFL